MVIRLIQFTNKLDYSIINNWTKKRPFNSQAISISMFRILLITSLILMQFYTMPTQHLFLHFFCNQNLWFNFSPAENKKCMEYICCLFLSGPSKQILRLLSQLLHFFTSLYGNKIFAKDRPYRFSGALPWAVKTHLALYLHTNINKKPLFWKFLIFYCRKMKFPLLRASQSVFHNFTYVLL